MHLIAAAGETRELPRKQRLLTRRRFLGGLLGSMACAAGYTACVEPFWTELVHRPLILSRLPAGLRGLRLVQMSDLHISARVSERHLLRAFARVEALWPRLWFIRAIF